MKQKPLIRIYSTAVCPYCEQAKRLLEAKSLSYDEIRIDQDDKAREIMIKESGGKRTVPQIFINNEPIGGFTDLCALEQSGGLNALLERMDAEVKGT